MSKQTVRFLSDEEVIAQGKVAQSYEAGEEYDLDDSVARRWVRRGKAEFVTGETEEPPKTPPEGEPKKAEASGGGSKAPSGDKLSANKGGAKTSE